MHPHLFRVAHPDHDALHVCKVRISLHKDLISRTVIAFIANSETYGRVGDQVTVPLGLHPDEFIKCYVNVVEQWPYIVFIRSTWKRYDGRHNIFVIVVVEIGAETQKYFDVTILQ